MAVGFKCTICGKRTRPNDTVTVGITSLLDSSLNRLCTLCSNCGLKLNNFINPKTKE